MQPMASTDKTTNDFKLNCLLYKVKITSNNERDLFKSTLHLIVPTLTYRLSHFKADSQLAIFNCPLGTFNHRLVASVSLYLLCAVPPSLRTQEDVINIYCHGAKSHFFIIGHHHPTTEREATLKTQQPNFSKNELTFNFFVQNNFRAMSTAGTYIALRRPQSDRKEQEIILSN